MREVQNFIYCIEALQAGFCKVGTSFNPKSRFHVLRQTAPFEMRFRHVVKVPTRIEADAWERHIIAKAERYRSHGEWVIANSRLDGLFAEIDPGENCTWAFQTNETQGRVVPDTDTMPAVRRAVFNGKLGVTAAASVKFSGDADDVGRATIHARLRAGYGVEDIHALDGLPLADIRAEISKLTADGQMRRVLGLSPTPTEARA